MSEKTICGGCNCRVSIKLQHPDDHNCVLIADLKKDMNLSLSEIQNDYERRIKNLDKKLSETDHVANCQAETISILCGKVHKLENELSTCIDVKLLYSDRQAREAWQKGYEVMIETLHKKIVDLEYMFKQTYVCVDNSHAEENAKRFGLAPVSQLNKMAMGELKVSRKHLEGKLREKNELTKQMQENINELEEKLQRSYQDYHELSQKNKLLIESCAKRDNEIDKLKYRLKFCCCPNQIRTWAGMKDEPK